MKTTSLFFILSMFAHVSRAQNISPTAPSAVSPQMQSQLIFFDFKDSVSAELQDEASVRVRDTETGRQAQVHLTPSPVEKRRYTGSFVIEFARGDRRGRTFEFLSPSGKALFVSSSERKSVQTVNLFTDESDWTRFVQPSKAAGPAAPVISVEQQQAKAREEAQRQQQARVKMEEDMALKRAELLREQEAMNAKQRRERAAKAASLMAQGIAEYKKENYKGAEQMFVLGSELDPSNDSAYFQYGVTMYKLESYNKSLALLSMAEGSDNENERAYYMGLNHMKLREYEQAEKKFVELREENDPQLSAVASFFAGNIQFQTQKYAEARKSFEYVIDNSKDPQMDKASDAMLEDIDRIENFLASSKEKYRFTFAAGTIYDSNALGVADSNLNTGVAAYRATYGVTGTAILHRTMDSNLSATVGLNDYYSWDKNFQDDALLQAADALDEGITVPWQSGFKVGDDVYNYDLTAAYHSILLAYGGEKARKEAITNSTITAGLTIPMSAAWFLRPKIEFGNDKSLISPDTDDDQTGTHTVSTLSNTWLVDLKGTKSWTLDLGYANYATKGIHYQSTKPSASLAYAFPAPYASDGVVRLDYSSQAYDQAALPRTDQVTALSFSDTKEIKKNLTLSLLGLYQTSTSGDPTYTYDKFMISASLTYLWQILDK